MVEQSLKEQTNTVFENPPKNMSPQDYAQSYMEGLGITPIEDVNTDLTFKEAATNVGSVLPGIGTAMTVAEIEDELKKEDPSYGKIVLLGGSELVGLIPGLGTAAKAGLRKVAKKVGANKVVDALDSIPDSKDVAKQQMLIGPGAEGYDNRSLYKARELKAEGYSPKEIEEITGRVQVGRPEDYIPSKEVKYPQVPFKFEIPDKGIIIRKNDGHITLREASKQRPIRVGNLIPTHTKLFEQYPSLKNVAIYIDPKLGSGAHFDITDGTYGSIVIGPEHSGYKQFLADGNVNNPEFRRVFFHELQHAAQARDFQHAALEQLGGGPDSYVLTASGRDLYGEDFTKAAINNNPKFAELRDKMVKLFKEDTRGLDFSSSSGYSNPETAKKMAELMKELDYESYKTYLQTASEVEAAVVGARAKPTFGKDQPSVSSEVSKRKDVETYDEYTQGYSDSKIKKLLKRMTTRKADLTKEEIEGLTERGVNFVRYALKIDDKIEGIAKYSEGGLAEQTDTLFGYTAEGAKQEGERFATDVNIELTFRDAATFVAEATPIIGDAIAAKEVYDELKKENPNYLLVGALGGAALIGLIPGLGDAAAASIRKGARSALDTSKRMIPTKKVDDAYNPVIGFGGEDSYDPIVEKYLNQEPEELLALALKKDPTKADENKIVKFNNKSEDEKFALELLKEQAAKSTPDPEKLLALLASGPTKKNLSEADKKLIKDLDKELKLLDKDIDELQDIKDSGLFNNETDLLMAHAKGVLSTPEYFRSKYDFMQTKLNSLDPSDPKYREYEKFTDVYNRVDLASLLDFARDYPVEPNITGKQYLQYADDAAKYDKKLIEYADDIGVDPNDFIDVVQDAIPFVGDNVFPDYLPRAKETGDLYPRKATDYTESNTQSLMAKIPKGSDRAASRLGFDDTVYHLAVSKDEFTNFKNVDDLIPEVRDGPTNKFEGTPHDLLGVHVGTARAAAERFRAKSVDFEETPRYTMQLRAKLDKPVRVEDISEIVGFDPLKLQLDDSGLNFTEKDLKTIIYNKAMQKNNAGDYISTTMENQAAIELRKELADSGFTHIPYVNELEDKESISYIMLVDRKKGDPAVLRDYNAKFDPEEAASTDLRMSQGGVAMKDQMEMAFMQEGGLKDDGMDVDPVSGNDVPPGSMASEVRDDIPAQLSEGEYVVPADVVQYYGVKFFEELRMDAKRGLADMESNGRIGGEPVDMPMDMPMDDTPTVAVSTGGYIDGMPAAEYNVGGMTGSLYNNPTQMDQEVNNIISTMYNNPQVMDELSRRGIQLNRTQAPMNPQQMNQANPPAEARMGFNPGGLTGNEAAAYNYITSPTMPNPMYQTPGASYIYAAPPQLTTTAQEQTPSVEYCDGVGMDYDPVAKMCIPRPIEQASQGGEDNDDPGTNLPKVEPDKWMEDFDYSGTDEGMQNLLQQSSDLLDPPERTGLGGAVAGILDKGIFGKFSAGSNAAKVAANIIILDHYGVDTTALTEKWKSYTNENLSGVPKGLYNGDSFAKQAAIKHGLSLSFGALDPNENRIFKGRDDYRKFLENDERKENIRSRYQDMSINPLKSTGKKLTEKQKRDAKSDAGLSKVDAIVAQQGDDGPSAAQKAAARKRGDEEDKRQQQKIESSGQRVDTTGGTKKTIERLKKEGRFNVGGRNKGGLMKKKKK